MGEFLARWQFGLTTIFHFFFVPVTIGLCFIVATMQTLAYKRQDDPGTGYRASSGACS